MNPASEDVKDMLVAESTLDLVFPTDLRTAREPPKPNKVVTIYDTPGFPPQLTFKKGEDYFTDACQIRIRHTDYLEGFAIGELIRTSLHGRAMETWNGTLYTLIRCLNGPFMLQWDDNNRVIFIINFELQRR